MKYLILIIGLVTIALQGCKKCKCDINERVTYTVQNDMLQYGSGIPALDIDSDGESDMLLNVYLYMNNGWAVEQFYVTPAPNTQIAVQTGKNVMAFKKGELVTLDPGKGGVWESGRCVLFENRSTEAENVKTGNFSDAGIKYIGIKVSRNGLDHFGWIKVSRQAGANGKDAILIQRSAVQQVAGVGIITN